MFLGRIYFTGKDSYQNFLVFASMLSSLILDSNTKVTNWISTGISSEKTKPFDTGLATKMSNLASGRVNLKTNNSVLVQKRFSSLYSNFILNLVYELNTWPRNPINNFTLKSCLFGTVKLVRNTIKSKFTYNGRGIAFDGEGSWSFGIDFAQNVVIVSVDNSSSSQTANRKNNFLVLGEGPTQGINYSTGAAERTFNINFSKSNITFCLSLHYNGDESYLYVNKTDVYKFKAKDNISWYNSCLGSVSYYH